MNEIINSTPLSDKNYDTSLLQDSEDTLSKNKPENICNEPQVFEDKAEVKENNELIFGKFKTMEEAHKGYKEAQKAITKSAELEKQIKLYQEEAKFYEQDKLARNNGFSSHYEMALSEDVWKHEIDDYAMVATRVFSPQECLEVNKLIEKCYQSKSLDDIALLRRCFNPEIVASVSQDTAIYRNNRKSEYEQMSINDRTLRYNRKLNEFRQTNSNWIDSEVKKDLVTQALEISDGNVDLHGLKKLIERIEENAIDKYQKNKKVQQENIQMQNSLIEPVGDNLPKVKKKKWLTKEEYYKLSQKEEAEKYDLIVEQVKLEKQGLLPRILT